MDRFDIGIQPRRPDFRILHQPHFIGLRIGRGDAGEIVVHRLGVDRLLFIAGRDAALRRHDPDLQQMAGPVAAGVEFGMDDAGARAHALDFAGPDDAAAAAGILVLHRAFQNVGDDLHVAMGMGRKARAARDPVFVDDAQGAEAFECAGS